MHDRNNGPQSRAKEGAKNPPVTNNIHIGTYNVRTLLGERRLLELEEEIRNIKWDIIGLSETRRAGESATQLASGNMLYISGKRISGQSGVGFLINRNMSSNVVNFKAVSDRVAIVIIRLNST